MASPTQDPGTPKITPEQIQEARRSLRPTKAEPGEAQQSADKAERVVSEIRERSPTKQTSAFAGTVKREKIPPTSDAKRWILSFLSQIQSFLRRIIEFFTKKRAEEPQQQTILRARLKPPKIKIGLPDFISIGEGGTPEEIAAKLKEWNRELEIGHEGEPQERMDALEKLLEETAKIAKEEGNPSLKGLKSAAREYHAFFELSLKLATWENTIQENAKPEEQTKSKGEQLKTLRNMESDIKHALKGPVIFDVVDPYNANKLINILRGAAEKYQGVISETIARLEKAPAKPEDSSYITAQVTLAKRALGFIETTQTKKATPSHRALMIMETGANAFEELTREGVTTPEILLTTYKVDMTSEELLTSVKDNIEWIRHSALPPELKEPLIAKHFDFIERWLDCGYYDAELRDDKIQGLVREIIGLYRPCKGISPGLKYYSFLEEGFLEKKIKPPEAAEPSYPAGRTSVSKIVERAAQLKGGKLRDFIKENAPVVARDLKSMQAKSLLKVNPNEILIENKPENQKDCPNHLQFIEGFNQFSNFVSVLILNAADGKGKSLKDSERVMEFFLTVAQESLKAGDLISAQGILSAFGSSPINRLFNPENETFVELAGNAKKLKQELENALSTDHSSRNPRNRISALKASGSSYIPYTGMFLTDTTFIRDGNPGKITIDEKELLSATRQRLLMSSAQEIIDAKKSLEGMEPHHETDIAEVIKGHDRVDEKALFALSLKVSPRKKAEPAG